MSKILSQDEIDALLESSTTVAAVPGAVARGPNGQVAAAYNFRRPDRISKEQLRSLHFLHDRFAHNVSTSLSAFLRSVTEVTIVSVEQFAYSEFLMAIPGDVVLPVSLDPLEGWPQWSSTPRWRSRSWIGFGGTGENGGSRPLTEIEQNVIDSVMKLMLDALSGRVARGHRSELPHPGRETRPQMLQVMGPNEIVVLLGFDIKVADSRGMLNLCIPATAIEATGEKFIQGSHAPPAHQGRGSLARRQPRTGHRAGDGHARDHAGGRGAAEAAAG